MALWYSANVRAATACASRAAGAHDGVISDGTTLRRYRSSGSTLSDIAAEPDRTVRTVAR